VAVVCPETRDRLADRESRADRAKAVTQVRPDLLVNHHDKFVKIQRQLHVTRVQLANLEEQVHQA